MSKEPQGEIFGDFFRKILKFLALFVIYTHKKQNITNMRTWKVTIKEVMCESPITTIYRGDIDYEGVKEFFGCDQPDVEWYKIEEE